MIRLIVVVEGQTEEAFIKDVLAPHLAAYSVYVSVTIVGKMTAHRRGHQGRGGGILSIGGKILSVFWGVIQGKICALQRSLISTGYLRIFLG